MSRSKSGRRRRWPIMLLEFSPLIAVGYLAAVLAIVPMSLAAQMVAYKLVESKAPEFGTIEPRVLAAEWMRMMEDPEAAREYRPEDDPFYGLEKAKAKAYEGMLKNVDQVFTGSNGNEPAFDTNDAAFQEMTSWESTAGAGVWAFVAKAPTSMPDLVFKAEYAPEILPTVEEMASCNATDMPTWLWRQNMSAPPSGEPPRKYEVFNSTVIQGGSIGGGDGTRDVFERFLTKGDDLYRLCAVMKSDPYGGMQAPFDEGSEPVDPTTPAFLEQMKERARDEHANIYLLGPFRVDLIPLREPEAAPGSAAKVADAVWPGDGAAEGYGTFRAEGDIAEAVDPYSWVTLSPGAASETSGPITSEAMYVDGSGFLFVVGMNENPMGMAADELLDVTRNPWRRFQLDAASNSALLLGFGLALMGASLVASPAAFIYDRKREAQDRVLAEMQRVQQDAHDKVYNRLSALSKRAELTSATVSESVAKSMGAFAEDIRNTVTDLQRILGDAERASAVAPVQSTLLVDQTANACRVQAERLGIEIVVRASALPDVDPQVGWDVQCIVEEAVNNAGVRGGAKHVEVILRAGQDALIVEVIDDGRGLPDGFDINTLPEMSTGLRGMRSRVERRGGTLRLERREAGALLSARVPLV